MPENVGLELPTSIILGLHLMFFIALVGLAALPIHLRGRLIVLLVGLLMAVLLPFWLVGDLLLGDLGPDAPVFGVAFYNYFALSFILPIFTAGGIAIVLARRASPPSAIFRAIAGGLGYAAGFGLSMLFSVSDVLPSTLSNYLRDV